MQCDDNDFSVLFCILNVYFCLFCVCSLCFCNEQKKSTKQSSAVRPTTPTVPASPVRIVTPPVNSASPSTTLSTPAVSGSGNAAPPSSSPSPSSAKSSKVHFHSFFNYCPTCVHILCYVAFKSENLSMCF